MILSDVRGAIAAALATIPNLSVKAREPDSVNVPAAVIGIGDGVYDDTFGGTNTVIFSVLMLVSKAADASKSIKDIDLYLDDTGERSVKAAIEADGTLGGVVQSAVVLGWSGYNGTSYNVGNVDYAGVEIHGEVMV